MIFILNRQEKVIATIKNSGGVFETPPFFDDILTQDLPTGAETFVFTTPAKGEVARSLLVGNFVAFKIDNDYKLFQIMRTEESHEDAIYTTVYSECAGLELINKVFRKTTINSCTLKKFMETVLQDTGWNVGCLPLNQITLDLQLEDASVYEIIQNTLGKFGVELEFSVEINQGRISRKIINVYTFRGKVTGKRFEFGQDIDSIQRTIDSTELYTALIGRGKDGIDFKDIVVEGIDKPKGQDFVADKESFNRYNHNGYHIIGVFEFETTSPEELLRETYKTLQKTKNPKVTYEVDVALLGELLGQDWNNVAIGDTVAIVDNAFNPPINLMARVAKLETSFTDPQSNKCTLTNFIEVKSNITDEMRKLAGMLEGYVDDSIGNKFPIGNEDIQDGAVDGDKIYQDTIRTDHLISECITTDKLQANSITTDKLQANSITADKIVAGSITADKIDATFIQGLTGQFENLFADIARIDNIFAGNITADMIQAGTITGASGVIGEASIGSGQISELNANKIKSGTVDTSLVKVASRDGEIEITGYQVLVHDTTDALNKINRVVLGKYRKGETFKYGLVVRGEDGQTIMLDEQGVHNAGITSGAVDDNKIADDANIKGYKLDINSVIRTINSDGTELIAGTVVQVGDRTLEVELSTQKNLITDNKKQLETQKSQIIALDNEIKLKVDNQKFTETIAQVNQKTIEEVAKAKTELKKEITETNTALGNLNDQIHGSFKDGVISEVEAITIKNNLQQLEKEKLDLHEQYLSVYNNADITSGARHNLYQAKQDYETKHTELVSAINKAIEDMKATPQESADVNNKTKAYSTSLSLLSKRMNEAIDSIVTTRTQGALAQALQEIEQAKSDLRVEITDVNNSLGDLDNTINTVFKDGVLSESECKSIAERIKQLDKEMEDVNGKYTNIYNHNLLSGISKTNLYNAKQDVDTKSLALKNSINSAITDKKATIEEKNDIDTKMVAYGKSLSQFSQKLNDAIDFISSQKSDNTLAEAITKINEAKTSLKAEIVDVDNRIDDLILDVDGAIKDGIISETEAMMLENDIKQLDKEKMDLDKQYLSIYNNPILTGVAKSNLSSAKTSYDTVHTNLKKAIQDAIANKKVTDQEKTNINNLTSSYSTSFSLFSQRMNEAIDFIINQKADETLTEAITKVNEAKAQLKTEITEVGNNLSSLDNEIKTSFKDGIVSEAETIAIKENLKSLDVEKKDVDKKYTSIYGNPSLEGVPQTNLYYAKKDYDAKHTDLKNAINSAIADKKITPSENTNVTNKTNLYGEALSLLSQRLNEAIDAIATKKNDNTLAEAIAKVNEAKAQLKTEINDVSNSLNSLENNLHGSFKDGVISEAEAIAIGNDLKQLDKEKQDIDAKVKVLHDNTDLTGISRSNLESAKSDYNGKHATLKQTIQNVIADGKATPAEKNQVNDATSAYSKSLATLSRRINEAIDSIANKKSQDAITSSNKYSDGQVTIVTKKLEKATSELKLLQDQISLKVSEVETKTTTLETTMNNLQVGGANLIDNSGYVDDLTHWAKIIGGGSVGGNEFIDTGKNGTLSGVGLECTNSSGWCILYNGSLLARGFKFDTTKKYTLSGYIWCDRNITMDIQIADGNSNSQVAYKRYDFKTGYTEFEFSFAPSTVGNENQVRFCFITIGRMFVPYVQLQEGNKASSWKPSEQDTKDSYTEAINTAKNQLQGNINSVSQSVGNLSDTMNSSFRDSVISNAEALAIQEQIHNIDREKVDLDKKYNNLYNNADLSGNAKSELLDGKNGYNASHTNLKNTINNSISDKQITDSERNNVRNKLNEYASSLSRLSEKMNNAVDAIANKKASDALNSANNHTNNKVSIVDQKVSQTNSEIVVLKDKITQTVTKNEFNSVKAELGDKISANKTEISKNKAEIVQTTDGIKQQVSNLNATTTNIQNNLTGVTNRVDTVSNKVTTLETSVGRITAQVSDVEVKVESTSNKLNNLQVGGTNLVDNSGYIKTLRYWDGMIGGGSDGSNVYIDTGMNGTLSGAGLRCTNNSGWCILYNNSLVDRKFKFTIGKDYMLSGMLWTEREMTITIQICDGGSTNVVMSEQFTYPQGYHKFNYHFIPNIVGNLPQIRFCLQTVGAIFVPYVQLQTGNKASEWQPSVQDTKDSYTEAINSAKEALQNNINNTNSNLNNLTDTMNGSFKDQILDSSEIIAIKEKLKILKTDRENLTNQFNVLYNNNKLTGSAKSNLHDAKHQYDIKHDNLVNTINSVISTPQVSDGDMQNINNKTNEYTSALGVLSKRTNEAVDFIAQAKANEALNNANNHTNNQITTVNQRISGIVVEQDKINSTVGNVQHTLTQTNNKLNDTTNKLDNLQIGSRNLIPNSSFSNDAKEWNRHNTHGGTISILNKDYENINSVLITCANNTQNVWCGVQTNITTPNLTINTCLVLSTWVYIYSNEHQELYLELKGYRKSDNVQEVISQIPLHTTKKEQWINIKREIILNKDYVNMTVYYFVLKNGKIKVAKGKLEKGNKATDWTPAPEDVLNQIEDIDLGGLNLIENSGYIKDLRCWNKNVGGGSTSGEVYIDKGKNDTLSGAGLSCKKTGGWCILYNDSLYNRQFKFEIGKDYMLSGLIWTDRHMTVTFQICDGDTTNYVFGSPVTLPQGYNEFNFKFTPSVNGNHNFIRFAMEDIGTINVFYVQLQTGNKASEWQPSPFDTLKELKDLKVYTETQITNLTQDKNKFQAIVTHAGGSNILKNSNALNNDNKFWHNDSGTELVKIVNDTTKKYFQHGACFCLRHGYSSEKYAYSYTFALKPSTYYTITYKYQVGTDATGIDLFVLASNKKRQDTKETDYTRHYFCHGDSIHHGDFKTVSFTFETHSDIYSGFIRVDNNGVKSGHSKGAIFFGEIMLVEGKLQKAWSPHPTENYTGTTTIDTEGVRVEHNDSDTYTQMSHDGVYIVNKQDSRVIANFGTSDGGSFSNLQIDNVTCSMIQKYVPFGSPNLYVSANGSGNKSGSSSSNSAATIQSALDNWREEGTVLRHWQMVTINIANGQYYEDFHLQGFSGVGTIKLSFHPNCILTGSIRISYCNCRIIIDGSAGSSNYGNGLTIKTTGSDYGVKVLGSNYVVVNNLRFKSTHNKTQNFLLAQSSKMEINRCDISNTNCPVVVQSASNVTIYNCIGSNNNTVGACMWGGVANSSGSYCPQSSNSGKIRQDGGGFIHDGASSQHQSANGTTPPSTVIKTMTNTFAGGNYRSFRRAEGWKSGIMYQGSWNSGYGDWRGHCDINCVDWCKTSTNISGITGRVWLQRKSNSHGASTGSIYVCDVNGNTYGTIGSLSRGASNWFSLPSNAVQALVRGDGLCFYNTNANNYIQFENNTVVELTGQFRV